MQLPELGIVSCGWYERALRSAVLAVKDGRRDVALALGERIAPLIAAGAVLVPVPTTRPRRRVRGIDGVTLIAQTAASIVGADFVDVLEHRAGDAQRGRTRGERLAARNRFSCVAELDGRTITLIDDVCTTGATLADCARAIHEAG